jgi:DNA-binding transcriptional ArsR family regulator
MSAPAVSKHLRVLETAGLIARTRRGRHQLCTLRTPPLVEADRWCQEQLAFWAGSLDSLEEHLLRDRT